MGNRWLGSMLAGYWDQCRSSFVTRTGGGHVTVHKFQNSRGIHLPAIICWTSKHKHCMNYESLLFSRQAVYQASLCPQWELCLNSVKRTFSFPGLQFSPSVLLSQEIIICRIPKKEVHDSTVKSVKTTFPGLCSLHWRSPPPPHLTRQEWKENIYQLNQQRFLALKQQPL